MKNVAYKRVSTVLQETDRQFHGMTFDIVFEEKISGKNTDRPQLQACLDSLESGDILHVWEISRLARSLSDLLSVVDILIKKSVAIKFHKEGLEFSGSVDGIKEAMNKMQLSFMGSIAEFERAMIRERVREGMAVARAKGTKVGAAAHKEATKPTNLKRQHTKAKHFASQFKEKLEAMREVGMSYANIAEKFNIKGFKTVRGNNFEAMTVQRMCQKLEIS